jgi:predicted alpha/beta superfamily hydrolase
MLLKVISIILGTLLLPRIIEGQIQSQAILTAQPQPEVKFAAVLKGMVLPDVECSEFHSRFTGHDYHVYVSLPASYGQGDQRYPVLYVPDFDHLFLSLRSANSLMSASKSLGLGYALEEFILVGLPLKFEDYLEWARKRSFDLTPTEVEAWNTSVRKQYGGEVHTGGAPMFLRTLKEELIPYIDSQYRVTSDRGLAGYSLGGLFAAYVWLNDGNTFSRYLIGSPSLDWDKEMIFKAEAAVAKFGKTLHGRVFLSAGADEGEGMIGPLKRLVTAVTSHSYPSLRLESHIFEGEEHLSGMQAALSRGLKFLYARPQAKQ